MPSDAEIFEKVREALTEALGVEADEVTPEAKLQSDLGAESIDFLDIIFRLEKSFNIKIPRGELFPDTLFNDPNYVADGKLTPAGLAELKKRMPFANLDELAESPKLETFANAMTVAVICGYIKAKLSGQIGAA